MSTTEQHRATIVLTGAAGNVGSVIRERLAALAGTLRSTDLRAPERLQPNETFVRADVERQDDVEEAVRGADVVVHLGGVADEAAFTDLAGPNLAGAYHVYEAARRHGVRRVVYASSNRATGLYRTDERLDGGTAPSPDGLYGATKAFGEALGRMYAGRFGLEVVAIRIGSLEERPSEPRHLSTWLSHADAVRMFEAAVTAPSPLGFACVYGVSANTRSWWPLDDDARRLGYVPLDDAERAADGTLLGQRFEDEHTVQGGRYADAGYGGWAVA